jgi:hypothetical protein
VGALVGSHNACLLGQRAVEGAHALRFGVEGLGVERRLQPLEREREL